LTSSKWSESEVVRLKELWGTMKPDDIASLLGRTENSINHKASRLGIAQKKDRWTDDEIEFLSENWGKFKIETLCKKLGRTKYGVRDMAVRVLKLGPSTMNQGMFTGRQLANSLGVCNDTVSIWLKKCGLNHKLKITYNSLKVYQIDIKDFWKWAEKNQQRFDSCRFEKGYLGAEPEWMKEKRRSDYYVNRKVNKGVS